MKKIIILILWLTNMPVCGQQWLDHGDKALGAGKYDQAVTFYNKAQRNGANRAVVYFKLGNVYYRKNHIALAIDYFKKTVKLAPRFKNAYHNIAIICYKMEDYCRAKNILLDYLDIIPDDAPTLLLLGSVYKTLRDFTLAEKYLRKAVKADPDNEEAYAELAFIYNDLGDLETALNYIKKGITSIPDSLTLRETYAQMLKIQGKYKQAVNNYEIILNQFKNISRQERYYYTCEMCNAFIDAGLTNLACNRLKKIIRFMPREKRAFAILKYLYLTSGKIADGLNFFSSVYSLNKKQSYLAIKDLFALAYNENNKSALQLFTDFYEKYRLTDQLYVFIKEDLY
ncbi:MAG TPA: tetratricopeptide repeat protein [Spirochaetota bacterium]|nr:tetratricopeptide repeat protein [Spirochaetota bacterium]